VIAGADTVRSYQTILRQIVYFNRKPGYYLNRSFKLSCSELNGRFTSNDYIQTLTVIHPSSRSSTTEAGDSVTDATTTNSQVHPQEHVPQPSVAKAQVHEHKIELKDSRYKSLSSGGFLDSSLVDLHDRMSRPSASEYPLMSIESAANNLVTSICPVNSHISPYVVGHAVTVIIVVCIGFLVFMVALGVIRIRAAHHRTTETRDDEQEMVWDDSALTITVNPLDQIEQDGAGDRSHVHDEGGESDSSGTSYREDGDSSEEEEADDVLKSKSMTWDDSGLNF
jgi:hypothetical protein